MTPNQPLSAPGKAQLTFPTKLTAAGLVVSAIAIWMQWLSGDPAYPKVPPGPIIFVLVAAVILYAARLWWIPLLGALLSLMVTAGWFARFPAEMQRILHPASIGPFAAGICIGTALQIVTLLVTDVAGLAATVQNYRRSSASKDGARALCQILGVLLVLMGLVLLLKGAPVDRYQNLVHLVWGAAALWFGFAQANASARLFCLGSGAFFLGLGITGFLLGDPLAKEAWHAGPMIVHTTDHVLHLLLGTSLLATGLLSGRQAIRHARPLPQ